MSHSDLLTVKSDSLPESRWKGEVLFNFLYSAILLDSKGLCHVSEPIFERETLTQGPRKSRLSFQRIGAVD